MIATLDNKELGRLTSVKNEQGTTIWPARIKYTQSTTAFVENQENQYNDLINLNEDKEDLTYFQVQPYQGQRSSVASNSSAIDSRNMLERRQSRTSQSGLPDYLSSTVPPSTSPILINNSLNSNHSFVAVQTPFNSNVIKRSASTTPFISNAQPSQLHSSSTNAKIRHSLPKFKTQPIDYPQVNKGEPKNVLYLNFNG